MTRRALSLLVATALLAVGVLGGATGAGAHGELSIVRLAVASQGDDLVVRAHVVYENDRQPVVGETVLGRLSSTAGARSVLFRPDAVVPGLYAATVRLPAGEWEMTVSARADTTGSATGTLTVGELGRLGAATVSAAFDPGDLPAVASPTGESRSGVVAVAAALTFLLLLLGTATALHRRSQDEPASEPGRPVPVD